MHLHNRVDIRRQTFNNYFKPRAHTTYNYFHWTILMITAKPKQSFKSIYIDSQRKPYDYKKYDVWMECMDIHISPYSVPEPNGGSVRLSILSIHSYICIIINRYFCCGLINESKKIYIINLCFCKYVSRPESIANDRVVILF